MKNAKEELRKAIALKLDIDAADLKITDIRKNNGTSYTAIVNTSVPEGAALPAIPIDDVIEKIENFRIGAEEGADEVISRMSKYESLPAGERISDGFAMMDRTGILDSCYFQLVNAEWNRSMLNDVPAKYMHDLAAVVRIDIADFDGSKATALINNALCRANGITEQELFEAAMQNMIAKHMFEIRPMHEILAEQFGVADAPEPGEHEKGLFVGTNKEKQYGAAILMRTDLIKQISDRVNANVFVIPSSIHEVLLLADDGANEVTFLRQMVHDINRSEVAPEERLSDNVYVWNRERGKLEVA